MNEIERKFLVRALPPLEGITPLHYERYVLSNQSGKEVRIQKVNDTYFYEEKNDISELERSRTKKVITKEMFDSLKSTALGKIIRVKYDVSLNPNVAIQVYEEEFEGLIRAEVEFSSREEAHAFKPLDWMGMEITGLPIARDAELIAMSPKEFEQYRNVMQ